MIYIQISYKVIYLNRYFAKVLYFVGFIYAGLGGQTKEIRQSQNIQNILTTYLDQLDSILKQVEKILVPIRESVKNKKLIF
ncbi:MAG: hypothetical protein BGO10_08480 [Chlamydia sp. 32-24]|nr:MAG: hypothetical protein BGO10_08480 [Chlamydia sp. 32-24]